MKLGTNIDFTRNSFSTTDLYNDSFCKLNYHIFIDKPEVEVQVKTDHWVFIKIGFSSNPAIPANHPVKIGTFSKAAPPTKNAFKKALTRYSNILKRKVVSIY